MVSGSKQPLLILSSMLYIMSFARLFVNILLFQGRFLTQNTFRTTVSYCMPHLQYRLSAFNTCTVQPHFSRVPLCRLIAVSAGITIIVNFHIKIGHVCVRYALCKHVRRVQLELVLLQPVMSCCLQKTMHRSVPDQGQSSSQTMRGTANTFSKTYMNTAFSQHLTIF